MKPHDFQRMASAARLYAQRGGEIWVIAEYLDWRGVECWEVVRYDHYLKEDWPRKRIVYLVTPWSSQGIWMNKEKAR
jgi:hypothetical protein